MTRRTEYRVLVMNSNGSWVPDGAGYDNFDAAQHAAVTKLRDGTYPQLLVETIEVTERSLGTTIVAAEVNRREARVLVMPHHPPEPPSAA